MSGTSSSREYIFSAYLHIRGKCLSFLAHSSPSYLCDQTFGNGKHIPLILYSSEDQINLRLEGVLSPSYLSGDSTLSLLGRILARETETKMWIIWDKKDHEPGFVCFWQDHSLLCTVTESWMIPTSSMTAFSSWRRQPRLHAGINSSVCSHTFQSY